MPGNISGPTGPGGTTPLPPTAPTRPVERSRALVPVERTGPRAAPGSDTLLGRSGVDLNDLLAWPDLVETREAVAPVAMAVGLEEARARLLRQQPAESLAALDDVWALARDGEEGWYLRSGALTVLGLPGEGERVAAEGLAAQPASLALRLVQSVARVLVGDLSGARAALGPALDVVPDDPVLLAQQAVVLARQGHTDDATDVLEQLQQRVPDHPALAWARREVRSAQADRTRNAARTGFSVPLADVAEPRAVEGEPGALGEDPADLVHGAFSRLGRVLTGHGWAGAHEETLRYGPSTEAFPLPQPEAATEVRALLRAFSAGGTLGTACTPEQGHAARATLAAFAGVLSDIGAEDGATRAGRSGSPLTDLVATLVPLIGAGRADDAQRALRRLGLAVPPAQRLLLEQVIGGAVAQLEHSDRERRARATSEHAERAPFVQDDREEGPIVPIRLGLSLLPTAPTVGDGPGATPPTTPPAVFTASGAVVAAEGEGTGWGAALAGAGTLPRDRVELSPRSRQGREGITAGTVAAVLFGAAALGAAANGATVLAVVMAIAAVAAGRGRPRID